MNKEILRIALPAIVANITIPLLGLIDIGIAGHLGQAEYIGALAVGALMFNLIYWNFAFLRMGTSGLTAQCFGKNDTKGAAHVLVRAFALGAFISALIIIFQYPLQWLALLAIGPSAEVLVPAQRYFFLCVWGAPAILVMMGVKGWFLGMQDSRSPMYISITVNVVNVIASVLAVFVFKFGFIGIAIGTVIAEYFGLIFAFVLIYRKHKETLRYVEWRDALDVRQMGKFFSVNRDIFLRSMCLMIVTLFFMSVGARSGDIILAVNALIMQLFILFSYFMDGFAFAGEALVGRYSGARDYDKLNKCIKYLFGWGMVVTALYTIAYTFFTTPIFQLLTDDAIVVATAVGYRWWCVAIPIAGVTAFVWDGVYIGLTATRGMVVSIMLACGTFFAIYLLLPGEPTNDRLWLAFISYLLMRSVSQSIIYRYSINPTRCK